MAGDGECVELESWWPGSVAGPQVRKRLKGKAWAYSGVKWKCISDGQTQPVLPTYASAPGNIAGESSGS